MKHISKLKKIENDYVIATKSVPKKVVARLSNETDPCKNWCQMKYLQIERKKKIKLFNFNVVSVVPNDSETNDKSQWANSRCIPIQMFEESP